MRSKGSVTHRDRSALSCSVCGRRFFLDETDSPPFCCERCKMIDLGRWLDEEIGVPHEGGPERGDLGDQEGDEDVDNDDAR